MNALIQEKLDRESEPVELDAALVGDMEKEPPQEPWPGSRTYRRLALAILVSGIVLVTNIFLVVHGLH